MLLDKNPQAGFLSPHAPAGAARLQGGLSRLSPPGSAGVVRRKTAAARATGSLDIMEAGQEKARQEKRQQKREREKARERQRA